MRVMETLKAIKAAPGKIKQSYKVSSEVGGEIALKAIIEKYDKWRKVHYWVWWFFFLGAVFNWAIWAGPGWLAAFGFFGLSNHVFLNQIWWKLRTIEEHYNEVLENGANRKLAKK